MGLADGGGMNLNSLPWVLAVMSDEGRLFIKFLAVVFLIGSVGLGHYFYKNQHRWFGREADIPSDTSGGREYGRMQTWVLYWGMVIVFAYFAIVL